MLRKLMRGNPEVCIDDDDHPLDRTLRRRGFSARTCWMSGILELQSQLVGPDPVLAVTDFQTEPIAEMIQITSRL